MFGYLLSNLTDPNMIMPGAVGYLLHGQVPLVSPALKGMGVESPWATALVTAYLYNQFIAPTGLKNPIAELASYYKAGSYGYGGGY